MCDKQNEYKNAIIARPNYWQDQRSIRIFEDQETLLQGRYFKIYYSNTWREMMNNVKKSVFHNKTNNGKINGGKRWNLIWKMNKFTSGESLLHPDWFKNIVVHCERSRQSCPDCRAPSPPRDWSATANDSFWSANKHKIRIILRLQNTTTRHPFPEPTEPNFPVRKKLFTQKVSSPGDSPGGFSAFGWSLPPPPSKFRVDELKVWRVRKRSL